MSSSAFANIRRSPADLHLSMECMAIFDNVDTTQSPVAVDADVLQADWDFKSATPPPPPPQSPPVTMRSPTTSPASSADALSLRTKLFVTPPSGAHAPPRRRNRSSDPNWTDDGESDDDDNAPSTVIGMRSELGEVGTARPASLDVRIRVPGL